MHVCSDSGEDLISTEVLTVHSWPDLDATSKELQSRYVDLLMEQSLWAILQIPRIQISAPALETKDDL